MIVKFSAKYRLKLYLGAGDLASLGLVSLGLSPAELCCCLACCRHLARRFLNQTFNNVG